MKKIMMIVLCMSLFLGACMQQKTNRFTILEWYEMLAEIFGHINKEDDRVWFEELGLTEDSEVTYEVVYVSLGHALNLKEHETDSVELKNHPQGLIIQSFINLCKIDKLILDKPISKEDSQRLLDLACKAMRDFSFIDQSYRYTFKEEPQITDYRFDEKNGNQCPLEDGLYKQEQDYFMVQDHIYRKASFTDIFEDFECQGTFSPNLQEGIKFPNDATNLTRQGFFNHQSKVKQLSALPFSFELKGYKVKGSVSKDSLNVRVSGKVKGMDLEEIFSLDDLKITTDIAFNPFGKQRLLLRADYDAKNHISLSKELKKMSNYTLSDLVALKNRLSNLEHQQDTLEEIDIASFSFQVPWTTHTITVELDLRLSFNLNGEVGLMIESKQSHGVNVEHFRLNKIQYQDVICNPYIEGNMEGCIGLGLGMSVLNCSLVDFVVETGLGATCKSQIHLVDTKTKEVQKMSIDASLSAVNDVLNEFENTHERFVDTCIDVDTYWLVRFRAGSAKTLVHKLGLSGKFTPLKKKMNIYHFENRLPVLSCTRKYNFVDMNDLQTDITISKVSLTMKIGQIEKIELKTNERIVSASYASSDSNVATVDQNGNIQAVGSGLAIIEVKTDKGQTYYCKVYVPQNNEVEFTPLNSAFFLLFFDMSVFV